MRILSIETSAKACSAAVTEDGALLASAFQCSGLTHSRTLMPMVEGMLKNADLSLAACDAIAVAVGPGSFTGIRIGVAAAKGLAWARMLDGKVTSSYQKFLTDEENAAILERAGISPAVLVSAQDAVPKPAPDGILLAARSLRLPPEQVLYIGDSLTDEAAARAAGCGFIALTTGATLPEEFARDTELCENLIALRERLGQEGRA